MKLLWVNPSFLDYRIPLYKEIDERLNKNFKLVYSSKRIPERCDKKIKEAIGDNAISIKKDKIISIGSGNGFANKGINIPITGGLYKSIKQAKPEIIIAEGFFQFTPLTLLYAFIHRIPLIIAYERTKHTERNCPFYRRWYRRFINLFVSGYVVNGSLTKEYLISQGVKPEVIFTGAMCADSAELSKKVLSINDTELISYKEEILKTKEDKGFTYIFVGRIIPLKGIKYLLKAWEKHIIDFPHDKLCIVGDGELLNDFKKEFSHSSIIFTGAIDYSQIHKYYAVADVFIIPTLEDNWSLVVPEAMACGLPVACSIYNGCHPELVKKDINGRTFDPLNEEDIVETLSYFHSQNLKEMGKNSIEIEKEFSPEKTAENIINAARTILTKK